VVFGGRRHATALMPSIEAVLAVSGVTYSGLSGIVVADGPGSFTGLRIGFATAKGILLDHDDLTLTTAPSLLATAWPFRFVRTRQVAAMYDALRGDVFGAIYSFDDLGVTTKLPPKLATVTQLTEQSDVVPSLAVGDGAVLYSDHVREWTGSDPVGPPAAVPRAGALLELLAVDGATRVVRDPASFEPEYGRLAEAQVRWEAEHGEPLI
jgi:tRNA threonylcarbamoyladenosine biosynthesis protein TsaB